MLRIESLLSARLFLAPQRVGKRLFFMSNMSGHISLYAMDWGGSVPEPLIPPQIALQNPDLVDGHAYCVLPELGKILVMMDKDGDENYQPTWVHINGGMPQPAFTELAEYRISAHNCDYEKGIIYFAAQSRKEPLIITYRADLKNETLEELGRSAHGFFPAGSNEDHTKAILILPYTPGDHVIYLAENGKELRKLYGLTLEERTPGQEVFPNAIGACFFVNNDQGLLCTTALFEDSYGLGYMDLANPGEVKQVKINGLKHSGAGEMTGLEHLNENCFKLSYNIDGCSWGYEGSFDHQSLTFNIEKVIYGEGQFSGGVVDFSHYEEATGGYAFDFTTAMSPAQIYTSDNGKVEQHTRERILGIEPQYLSPGEDASFISHDGLRISARLYLPAPALKYEGKRPLVYYIHGGPQSQERPKFTWFSMPLIQFLTMNGFAVFVPNVRGSSGYGLSYMKHVDKDWGGQDRLDHVHAMTKVLPNHERVDVSRAGVVGRSYGGYMTLMLSGRHPELWKGAVDMFGPYDLFTFVERMPPTWRPYFELAIGHPERDKDFLTERSPKTYMKNLSCPMLVIQGKNDPRVVEAESRDVVEQLKAQGKQMEYLMFEDEGHDVLKFQNRVTCYNAITDFFKKHL